MKNRMFSLVFGLLLAAVTGRTAPAGTGGDPFFTVNARLNTPVIDVAGGKAYLVLTVKPIVCEMVRRAPLNLCVVLDRSGSMGDEGKMEYAKRALKMLVDQLSSEDYLSIVMYDNEIDIVREMARVRDKSRIKHLIDEIYPRNSTNLGGGMIEGFRQVERAYRRGYVNRVILLSDGLANQGITDPFQLNRIARRFRAKSISLTTMGVGLDYNENLMMGLAESGGGNYHFIERPSSLASIFEKEFHRLSSLVADNVVIEIKLLNRVRVSDVIGAEFDRHGDRLQVHLGGLHAGEEREVTVELAVPSGKGSQTLVSGEVRGTAKGTAEAASRQFLAAIQYTGDKKEVEEKRDLETQAKADVATSTRRVEQALNALDKGQKDEAAKELDAAAGMLMASPAASQGGAAADMVEEQVKKLREYQETISNEAEAPARAKKAIQFDNYNKQKKNQ